MTQEGRTPIVGEAHYAELEVAGAIAYGILPPGDVELEPGDYLHMPARALVETAVAIRARGEEVTASSVLDELSRTGKLDAVGGFGGLSDLQGNYSTPETLGIAALRVRRASARRRLVDVLGRVREGDLYDVAELQYARKTLDKLEQSLGPEHGAKRRSRASDAILRDMAGEQPQRIIPTGFATLDDRLGGGLRSRQLTTVNAPPGSGKTALTVTWTWSLTINAPVLMVQTEIEPEEIAARQAAQLVGKTPDDIMRHAFPPAEAAQILGDDAQERQAFPAYAMSLEPEDGDPIAVIEAEARAIERDTGVMPVIVIDYLQMLAAEEAEQRRASVGTIANRLRRLARDLDAAILVVCSVARSFYGKRPKSETHGEDGAEDARAWLGSAKESGDVEFAAAVVMFLDVEHSAINQDGWIPARVVVSKARRGSIGFVGCRFHGPSGRWEEDNGALAACGQGARNGRDDVRVLAAITSKPGTMTARQLRDLVPGVSKGRVEASVRRLLESGDVETRKVAQLNERGQRRVADVLVPAGHPVLSGESLNV